MESRRGGADLKASDGDRQAGESPAGAVDGIHGGVRQRSVHGAHARDDLDQAALALRRAESELRLVSVALMSAQEIERKRIANELHDSIGQALGNFSFGIGIALDLIRAGNSQGAEDMLVSLATQSKQTVNEVRRIAMDLRPATLDDLGIVGTLAWFFREFRHVHPTLSVITDIDVREADVPVNLTVAIYRVVQEACSNVVRHSGANEVQVCIRRRPDSILLRIADNGCGIDGHARPDNSVHQGMGLRSMRDRVEAAGGHFHLESDRGVGTCILADWPCPGAAGDA